jgi:CelD/BcsL family acetyltransferase involved in cellulose biosynthesis
MNINVARTLEDLPSPLAGRLSVQNGTSLFQSVEWFQCLVDHGGFESSDLRILHGENLDWALMMHRQPNGRMVSLSNYYSPQFAVSGTPSADEWAKLPDAVMSEAGSAGCVELRHLKPDVAGSEALIDAIRQGRFPVETLPQTTNWYSPIATSSFDAFMADRPSRLKNTLRRATRRLEQDHAVAFELVDGKGPALEPAIDAYSQVYAGSWKPAENHPSFIPAFIRLAAVHGHLRLGVLRVDGKPVAAQLWLRDGAVSHIYKLSHDPRFQSYSVGSILTARMFGHAIEADGVQVVDFGTGDEAYKRDWVTHERKILQMQAIDPRRPRGLALMARRRVARLLRDRRHRAGSDS